MGLIFHWEEFKILTVKRGRGQEKWASRKEERKEGRKEEGVWKEIDPGVMQVTFSFSHKYVHKHIYAHSAT